MPLPPANDNDGMFEVCHNSFVNGKAILEDIYTSDQSKWVSACARDGRRCGHFWEFLQLWNGATLWQT
jgi:hypothetical protein